MGSGKYLYHNVYIYICICYEHSVNGEETNRQIHVIGAFLLLMIEIFLHKA